MANGLPNPDEIRYSRLRLEITSSSSRATHSIMSMGLDRSNPHLDLIQSRHSNSSLVNVGDGGILKKSRSKHRNTR